MSFSLLLSLEAGLKANLVFFSNGGVGPNISFLVLGIGLIAFTFELRLEMD